MTHEQARIATRSTKRTTARAPWATLLCLALVTSFAVAGPIDHAAAVEPPPFPGTLAEFYVVPDPLPPGAPGELIRLQPVSDVGGRTTLRMMYHSRDAQGRDRAVTGKLTFPNGPAPPGGWPVISTANGTTGLSSACAVSRSGGAAPSYGLDAVAVASDYIGLGPVGELQPYLSRPSEAHAVTDAVRAARNVAAAHAGTRWLVIGGSQGGHGSISTHELAGAWAPELELLGAVALAPAAMFDRVYNPVDQIVTDIVSVMALYGAETEHPEIDADDYVSPATAAVAASVLPSQCLGAIIPAFLSVPSAQFWTNDPRTTEPARSMSLANDVGNVAVDSPLLLVSGTADTIVVIDRSRDLFDRLCGSGQTTEYTEYAGATHDTIGGAAFAQVHGFLQARLDGDAPVDSCPAAPTTTTAATTPSTGPTSSTSSPATDPSPVTAPTSSAGALPAGTVAAAVLATPRFTG